MLYKLMTVSFDSIASLRTSHNSEHSILTHHVFEDGDLSVGLRRHVVTCCFAAVNLRLFGLGPAGVRRPPDAGQQTGGATHRVVSGPGRLLVPGFGWMAGDEQGKHDGHHGEHDGPLHAADTLYLEVETIRSACSTSVAECVFCGTIAEVRGLL